MVRVSKEDPAPTLLLAIEHPFAGRRVSQLRSIAASTLHLSRASIIVMLSAYIAYLVFQLWTHRQLFEAEAYYSVGATPRPFFASTIASPTPHPYIWGGQEILLQLAVGRVERWLQVPEMMVLLKGPVNEPGSSSREPNAKA
ncbi:G-box-binding factor 1-like [Cucumis melo var. makuwa]|uniref:G-box-binding factor 1-like n=1 Tax=Cucumis melo var. makuwa TaxID=1194695 RepID=A0A5A7UVQ0_CUCMM|nr:G-box-binding factor 1-like [Cucumis melo var. makuwa]